MKANLPKEKRLAVNIGVDFDGHCCWTARGLSSPGFVARGDFDAHVGVPRVLEALRHHGILGNFFVPGHTMETYPERFREVTADGHEIGAHGCYHESLPDLTPDEERRLMQVQLDQHLRNVGKAPRGYRSPSWDFTDATLGLLEEFGFDWDSSLMGRDFEAYRPRPFTLGTETPTKFGPESTVVEFPVSWHLDDIINLDFIPGMIEGLASTEVVFQRWRDHFDFARQRVPGGIVCFTVHPQTIGRAHNFLMFERLLEYMTSFDDVWFTTLSEYFDVLSD
ncbi:polysaccharide deacetylase [Paenarthrobacter sp. NPDC058040]|uniref:polysaccharide deacetylase family protein n=1 Tax=unclassified Paenarthrobacter TaxID=2634190 RepID=UPI0036D8DBF4